MAEDDKPSGPDWGRIDLNLFIPLNALLIERNVTKAAERIFVTQPAMSAALAKLRRVFDDPLLVRDGRELVLTSFAESLRVPVQQLLFSARDMLMSNQHFDPATDSRAFTIVASDYTAAVLLAPLLPRLIEEAPGVRIKIAQPRGDHVDQVRSGRCDLLFWPSHFPTPELERFPHAGLFTDDFVLVGARGMASFDRPLTEQDLATTPSVRLASITSPEETLDPITAESAPAAVATVSTFALALEMVARTDLVTTIQRRLFEQKRESLGLEEVEVAATLPSLTMTMYWHPRSERSPAHQWLRSRIRQAAAALDD
ncbi:LysR family transcriptional regulator [Lentzea sp. NBRC 102530]|uniref:LysR family transcriptional regulator n=1 Tax=Lentzea sp. NBRC 102530 TaxID=3032201 RepID=UPI0024A23FD6|nr:LysR family transcriptional regulator [Lentzea sp. NBRC 102530]GLY46843.1 LysR family transcriptional regulator [Lentzea sp. NBRC 102530]